MTSKILFLIGSLQAGGAERVAVNLCNYWSDCGLEVILVTGDQCEHDFYEVSSKVERLSLEFDYRNDGIFRFLIERVRRLLLLRNVFRKYSSHTIISSTTEISLQALIVGCIASKDIIVCEHNNYYALKSRVKRLLRRFLYFYAKKILVLTSRDRSVYEGKGLDVSVMPNPLGIDGGLFKRQPVRESNILIAVGRLTNQKAFHRLIHAAKGFDESTRLLIIGDGPLRESLESLIVLYDLSHRVMIERQTPDIEKFYSIARLLLMTSLYEGLPMVIGEAFSFGLPVVAFDCPTGPREMITDGVNGLLIPDGNIEMFRNEVNRLISSDSIIDEMSSNASRAAKTYKIESVAALWLEII